MGLCGRPCIIGPGDCGRPRAGDAGRIGEEGLICLTGDCERGPTIPGSGSFGANTGNAPMISSSRFRLREDGRLEKGMDPITGELDADLFPGRVSTVGRLGSEEDPLR